MTDANATFHIFKAPHGKWYTSDRGFMPESVWQPYYNAVAPRPLILEANGGKMPGLNSAGWLFDVVVILDPDVDYGWPLLLKAGI
jgi:hypothetical protein